MKFKRGDVIGKLCGLILEQDDYNGKTTSKVTKVIPVDEIDED